MLTALVAGIIVPIIFTKFGGPLIKSMESEREKLVNFIGQTPRGRKPPVPSAWFSQQSPAKPESSQLGEPGALSSGSDLSSPPGLGEPGSLQAGNLGEGKSLNEPGSLQAGAVDGGGGAGGGLNGGARPGSGTDGAGGDDFFSNSPEVPGAGIRGEKGDEEIAGRTRGGGGGGRDSQGQPGGGESGELGKASKPQDAKKGSDSQTDGGNKRGLVEAEAELDDRIQKKKFDWWVLIKVLIVIFILALIFLIVMGNTRKNG
jgi:hypothetical protein